MRAVILSTLQADAALMAALSGGIYDAAAVDYISRQATPAAFDASGELRPCGLLRISTDVATGPVRTGARLSFSMYLTQRRGTAQIETARQRAYALLHRVRLSPASGGAWEIAHADDVLDARDDALDAALIVSRYTVFVRKG